KEVSGKWIHNRQAALRILQEEADLEEIVRLVGIDALSSKDRLTLEVARSIREDFLHQNAFHEVDTYTSLEKQFYMLEAILLFYNLALDAVIKEDIPLDLILDHEVREEIARMKYHPEIEIEKIKAVQDSIRKAFEEIKTRRASA
ncbi:MAG: V-type ATP synthase subunit A, partial [Spirochaetes bacterium]